MCRGNYTNTEKVHVFSFPRNEALREKWIRAIPRANFTPTPFTKVCSKHFLKQEILWSVTEQDSRTGQIVTMKLKKPRLHSDAIPSQFPNCPHYFSKPSTSRKSRDEKRVSIDQVNFLKALQESREEYAIYQKSISYKNYDDLLTVLNSFRIPEGWTKTIDKEKVTIFKLTYVPGPVVTYAVIINNKLKVETFLYGKEMSIPNLKTPFTSNNLNEIKDVLQALDEPVSESLQNNNDNKKLILNHVTNIIDHLNKDKEDTHLSFISEQLKLQTIPKERYRYSANTMVISSIMFTISPHAYKYFRHSGCIILPHPETIKSVCNSYLSDPAAEDKQSLQKYARDIYKFLDDDDKYVVLLVDEIHIQPYVDYKGGNIVGSSCNSNLLATSAVAFMITSIKSNFKEVIHISPTSKLNHEVLFTFIKTVINNLEEIGFRVFCVVSDNNAINSKAMNNFSRNKNLSIVYPHPFDNSRPLFYLFDCVHLLKCVRNNWLNSKPDQILTYPDFETGDQKNAMFHALKTLHNLEHDKLLKFGYSLNLKALHPSNLERQNVKLALKVFNPFVVQALLHFGSNIEGSKDTANFIDIILTWWKIVNVKTPLKGKRLNDIYQEPITATNLKDPKLTFLEKMLKWLETWKAGNFSHKLSTQTHTALYHTIYGMLEISKYCFNELKMNYVLLGKLQTDPLEHRFGKYRQLAGGQYHISLRQLYESEKRLRIQSLLTLKSRFFGTIHIDRFCDDECYNVNVLEVQQEHSFIPNIDVDVATVERVKKEEMPVVTYLAGYCCYIV